jgi:methyl-accepting chemotaxis protein
LTEQIAQSNLSIANDFAETRAGFAESRANIEKLGEKIDSGFSELKAIAQAQQHEIDRIASSIDRLAETVASQAKTVDKQAQTVDRLALLLERVLVDRGQNN